MSAKLSYSREELFAEHRYAQRIRRDGPISVPEFLAAHGFFSVS